MKRHFYFFDGSWDDNFWYDANFGYCCRLALSKRMNSLKKNFDKATRVGL